MVRGLFYILVEKYTILGRLKVCAKRDDILLVGYMQYAF